MTMPKEMNSSTVVVAKLRVVEMKVLSHMRRVPFSRYTATATATAPLRANGPASSDCEPQLDSVSWCLDNSFPK